MGRSADRKSTKEDDIDASAERQVDLSILGVADRLREAMDARGLSQADLARASGVTTKMVSAYLNGSRSPGATAFFSLADALKINPRWLVKDEGPRDAQRPGEGDKWITLPRFDVSQFAEEGRPEPIEMVPLLREWLVAVRSSGELWLADMPSDAMPELAREGQTLVCQTPTPPLVDGRTYIFLLDGRPLVRRIQLRPEGVLLKTSDPAVEPIILTEERADMLIPVARVLGAINLNTV